MPKPAIICHGGAGHGAKDQPGVDRATMEGWKVIQSGGSALDAALAAVVVMENDPNLNAGTGSKMREDGSIQMDAAVMTSDGKFGSITCIEHTKNPILVAAELLDDKVNMLAGSGAREFADSLNIPRQKIVTSKNVSGNDTVGAIVRDSKGTIVVASSTGGCSDRPAGRIGDTPLIGAGLWCDNNVGVAATGIGEEITLKMSCIRIADRFSSGIELSEALVWGVEQFPSEIEVGFISISSEGAGFGYANTQMPWSSKY